jgi:hypothetical protein
LELTFSCLSHFRPPPTFEECKVMNRTSPKLSEAPKHDTTKT